MLVIGAGGGQEIETALATARDPKRHVDAVELAGGEERLLRRFFGSRPDFLLDQPGVDYRIGDGRSFLEMTTRRWDVIEMKEVNFHTFAGQASSAWTPSLLFTQEAIRAELEHLTKAGLLAMNRGLYYGGELPSTLELLASVRRATDAIGWELGPRLLILDRKRESGFQRMCVIAASPFSDDELARANDLATGAGLTVRRTPRAPYAPIEGIVTRPYREALARIGRERGLQVDALTDDRPFGYQYLSFASAVFGEDDPTSTPHERLQRSDTRFLLSSCLGLVAATLFVVTRSLGRVGRKRLPLAVGQLAVCGLLGIGFMLLEIILVERTSLLLGHPTVAFVAVVTSMLCGLGVGSMLSGRWHPEASTPLAVGLAATVLVVVALLAAGPQAAAPWFRSLPAAIRPWIAGLVLLAGAIPLGALLPSVLRSSVAMGGASAAACWSANAGCSVVGTLAAALLVRTVGFSATARAACLVYGAAAVLWLVQRTVTRRRAPVL